MSPIFVGPANDTNSITSLGGENNASRGASSNYAIESNAHGREWAALNKGKGLAWVKISGFDGGAGTGNAFLVYSEFVDGRLYCLAARFAGSDSSASPADNGNRTKWMCCRNPNDTASNHNSDWGSGTHTFNEFFDYSTEADVTKSARTRCWNKSNSRTLFTFHRTDQTIVQDRLVYDMTHTESWSTRMKTRGPGSGSDYFQNSTSVQAGSVISSTVEFGTKVDSSFNNIYAGVTDAEGADAATNDVAMIWFDDNGSAFANGYGIGWKRSGAGTQWPRISGNSGTTPTFDTTSNSSDSGHNYYGILCENSNNGDMRNRALSIVTLLVNVF